MNDEEIDEWYRDWVDKVDLEQVLLRYFYEMEARALFVPLDLDDSITVQDCPGRRTG